MDRKETRSAAAASALVVLAALTFAQCGRTMETSQPSCDGVSWGFERVGPNRLKPGDRVQITLTSLRREQGQSPVVGECDAYISAVTWESSAPAVASVAPVSIRSAVVTGVSPCSTDITARFLVQGTTPTSSYVQIDVVP